MKPSFRLFLSYILCLMATFAFWGTFHQKKISIWPSEKGISPPEIYTDAQEGGFSTAEFFASDSAAAVRAVLNSGIYHPHAGIRFPLISGTRKMALDGVNFSDMDSVSITFRSNADVALILFTADPNVSKIGDPLSLRPLRMDIPATRHYTEHRVSLSAIATNPLWFDLQGIEPDSAFYLNRVVSVALESGKGALLGLPTEIEIQKWEFFGENRVLFRICLFILIITTSLFIWGQVKIHGKQTSKRTGDNRK